MAIPAYPSHLPHLMHAQKSRSQVAPFTMNQPRRGAGYVQQIGTDTPVFWKGQFRFSTADAQVFQIWFTQIIKRGALPFIMAIKTEFGLQDHVCQFLPDGLADAVEEGGVWTFDVQIMARKQIIPLEFIDGGGLVVGLPNWDRWASILDQVVSSELPEA